jgi:hypothetical protein
MENRVLQSNAMLSSTLRLAFIGLTESQMLSILSHYQGEVGTFTSFTLPAAIFTGTADATDYTLTDYSWRYAEAPSVEDLPCGSHNVELTLESVPPISSVLLGLEQQITISLTPGAAAAAYGLGMTVRVLFAAGRSGVEAAGIDETVTLTLDPGAASGA